MPAQALPGLLVLVALIAVVLGAGWRAVRWRHGRPAAVPVIGGLLAVPRRYLVDVHDAVLRQPFAAGIRDGGERSARMHMLTAGGFVAATVLVFPVHLIGIGGKPLAWLLLLALLAMAAGAVLVWLRRSPVPTRLSRGGFDRLRFGLFAFIVFFALATLPAAGVGAAIDWSSIGGLVLLAVGLWACLEMYLGLALGPMKHALNGVLHLAWHPRPERFRKDTNASGLKPLNLDEPKLGAEKPSDFAWNTLLGFDACVQCGRCETACPAFAAGLPLNPKKLVQDLAAAQVGNATDQAYSGSPYPERPLGRSHGGMDLALIGADAMIHPDTLWACTTCRACVYECPMMIEHVDAIIELRRFETLEKGATPGKAPVALEELRAADTISGKPLASRLDWAADLKLPLLADKGECDVLLWVGEGGFDLRNQRTLRAVVRLLRQARVDFAVLGAAELDCGDSARRLGDEATFQALAKRNIATLAEHRFQRIVTADPHVLHALKNEYRDFGGVYNVIHHTTFLAELLEQGRLQPEVPGTTAPITYHDPCYLGRYNGEIDAPRAILRRLGADLVEMEKSGRRSSCCGWGGGATLTDIPGKRRIPDVRMDHARVTEAGTVAVACPNCAVMLEGVVQPRPEVADVAELLLAAVEGQQ